MAIWDEEHNNVSLLPVNSGLVQASYTGTSGADTYSGGSGADSIFGDGGNDSLSGGGGSDTIVGGAGADTLDGGAGSDWIVGGLDGDFLLGGSGRDTISYAGAAGPVSVNIGGQTPLATDGTGYDMVLQFEDIMGSAFNDTLTGNGGNNFIDGGAGDDVMDGGRGYDTFVLSSMGDTIVESTLNSEPDLVIAPFSYVLGNNVEYLSLSGTGNFTGTGNGWNNFLTGNSGNNVLYGLEGDDTLDGGAGNDTLVGGDGADRYFIDNPGDVFTEAPDGGEDWVYIAYSYTLGATFEHLILTGTANLDGGGNAENNSIYGNAGHNGLWGGGGNDYIQAGAGKDTVYGEAGIDAIIGEEGEDVLYGGDGDDVIQGEDRTLAVFGSIDQMYGEAGNDTVYGGLFDEVDGGDGNDLIQSGGNSYGGDGDDILYAYSSRGAVFSPVVASGGIGNDTIALATYYNAFGVAYADDGSVRLDGGDGDDMITGGKAGDEIHGDGGADTMAGGLGDDTYYVDSGYDRVDEQHYQGTDLIYSSVSYSLLGRAVENLVLTGSEGNSVVGNSLANALTGNSGNNLINGDGGLDTVAGGLGNDTYIVNAGGDVVIEADGGGIDEVFSTATYNLSAHVESLVLMGTANIDGTGNELNNAVTGNSGNNALNGGAGNDALNGSFGRDTLSGGLGDDSYWVDDAGDKVVEASGEGYDTIYASVTYSLTGRYAEVLELTGTANLNATGNSVSNTLIGNGGNNVLNGLGGFDTLTGGGGADVFLFQTGSRQDVVTDFSGSEGDLINVNAYTGGVATSGIVAQVGAHVVIDFGGGNMVTVLNASQADVLSHIIW